MNALPRVYWRRPPRGAELALFLLRTGALSK